MILLQFFQFQFRVLDFLNIIPKLNQFYEKNTSRWRTVPSVWLRFRSRNHSFLIQKYNTLITDVNITTTLNY